MLAARPERSLGLPSHSMFHAPMRMGEALATGSVEGEAEGEGVLVAARNDDELGVFDAGAV